MANLRTSLLMTMGNCNNCKYIPTLVDLVQSGTVDPEIDAYKAFDARKPGWVKVELKLGS